MEMEFLFKEHAHNSTEDLWKFPVSPTSHEADIHFVYLSSYLPNLCNWCHCFSAHSLHFRNACRQDLHKYYHPSSILAEIKKKNIHSLLVDFYTLNNLLRFLILYVPCVVWWLVLQTNLLRVYYFMNVWYCLLHFRNALCINTWCRVLLENLNRNYPHHMEPDGSLPHSRAPATCPCPEPDQSSSCLSIPLPEVTL